jgi:hypothetical protein
MRFLGAGIIQSPRPSGQRWDRLCGWPSTVGDSEPNQPETSGASARLSARRGRYAMKDALDQVLTTKELAEYI